MLNLRPDARFVVCYGDYQLIEFNGIWYDNNATFDTLKFVERLKAGGVPDDAQAKAEAEALVAAFSEAMDSQLATKSDINRLEREVLVIKWMVGLVLGGILTLIIKAFFPI